MLIFVLGTTILLARLIPAGPILYYFMTSPIQAYIQQKWIFTIVTLTSYVVAAIIALMIINAFRLHKRMSIDTPGIPMILTGLTLFIASQLPNFYFLDALFKIRITSYDSLHFFALANFFAYLLIIIGFIQALLSVATQQTMRQTGGLATTQAISGNIEELDPEWMEKMFGNKQ